MSDPKDEADEPSYEQLGEQGNPFGDTNAETEDEKDRAERHD